MSTQGFRSSILPHLPKAAVRKGRPKLVHARTAIEIWMQRELQAEGRSVASQAGEEVASTETQLLAKVQREKAELSVRYRLAKAQREELELSVRRGHLIDLDDFFAWYGAEVAGPIRKGLERLQLVHGKAAVDLVMRGIARADAAIAERSNKRDGG